MYENKTKTIANLICKSLAKRVSSEKRSVIEMERLVKRFRFLAFVYAIAIPLAIRPDHLAKIPR